MLVGYGHALLELRLILVLHSLEIETVVAAVFLLAKDRLGGFRLVLGQHGGGRGLQSGGKVVLVVIAARANHEVVFIAGASDVARTDGQLWAHQGGRVFALYLHVCIRFERLS